MGEINVEKLIGNPNKATYIKHLMSDIKALEQMLKNDLFEKDTIRIGAEQEFCLVTEEWEPANNADEILKELDEDYFTSELALYNLEINLDPQELAGSCFSKLHKQLNGLLDKADAVAKKHDTKIMLTGILPTIRTKHLRLSYMTPLKRYRILNDAIKELRKNDIELHIKS